MFEQAAAVEEFANNDQAARLAEVTGPYLHFALAEERAKRDRKTKPAETRQWLADDGARIITIPRPSLGVQLRSSSTDSPPTRATG